MFQEINGRKVLIKALEAATKQARAYGLRQSGRIADEIRQLQDDLAKLQEFNTVLGPYFLLDRKIGHLTGQLEELKHDPKIAQALAKWQERQNKGF